MTIRAAPARAELLNPAAEAWADVDGESVRLTPIALDAQPTDYVRVSWADRPYGNVEEVRVAAARDGDDVLVRLEWADSDVPNTEFQDAAAVFFPSGSDAPVATIGSQERPVDLWFWQANLPAPRWVAATGPGAFAPDSSGRLEAAALIDDGRWAVVLRGSASVLAPSGKLGVVVWDGSNDERAGIGAVTPEWITVELAG